MNKNENTTYQNLQNAAIAVLRGELIAPRAYSRKGKRSQISSLSCCIKKLEKEQNKSEASNHQ